MGEDAIMSATCPKCNVDWMFHDQANCDRIKNAGNGTATAVAPALEPEPEPTASDPVPQTCEHGLPLGECFDCCEHGVDLTKTCPECPPRDIDGDEEKEVDESKQEESKPPEPKTGKQRRLFLDAVVRNINKRYFAIKDFGGHFRVGWTETENIGGFKGEIIRTQSFKDFSLGLANEPVKIGVKENGEPKLENPAKVWLEHDKRLTYERVVFKPNETVSKNVKNLWTGFAVKPVKGNCDLYLGHVKENICQGDEELYDWVVKWMAYQVRHPDEPGHSAIGVKGEKGVGKNVFAEGFARLWGLHAIVVTDSSRVTKNFNAHLWNKCVLVADEAFFAGDPRQDRSLKGLITGPTISIEPKGVDSFSVPNLLRFIIIGNDEQLIHATADERRYLMLECGKKQQKKVKYFAAIAEQLENGGYEALLYHLLNEVTLAGFDVRNPPHTDSLREQMTYSANPAMEVIQECLVAGQIPGVYMTEDHVKLVNLTFLADWAVKQRPQQWGRVKRQSFRSIMQQLKFHHSRPMLDGKRTHLVTFPPLDLARKRWTEVFKYPTDWDDDETDWDPDVMNGNDFC